MSEFLFLCIPDNDKFPGLLIMCGGRFIGSLKEQVNQFIRHVLFSELPDTMPVPD
jgi:hypothetical protein